MRGVSEYNGVLSEKHLMSHHFLSLLDFSRAELEQLLDRARTLREWRGTHHHPKPLDGKSVAIIFEKPSTRTRVSFEVAIHELGGRPIILSSRDTQIGRGEPVEDTARVLGRYVHQIVARTFAHETLEILAARSGVPVTNALSDRSHPCQILADLLTARDRFGTLEGLRFAWIGDGNNMAYSFIEAAMRLPIALALACPAGYEPDGALLARAHAAGARVQLTHDPRAAAEGAQVVMTDVWASMGQEDEAARRRAAFQGYCVDGALMQLADPKAIVLHCLPAHRGEEITAEVLEGAQSAVFDQAESRLHVQKAVLEWLSFQNR
jgi:ornithine carbamoyltransferase